MVARRMAQTPATTNPADLRAMHFLFRIPPAPPRDRPGRAESPREAGARADAPAAPRWHDQARPRRRPDRPVPAPHATAQPGPAPIQDRAPAPLWRLPARWRDPR